MAEAERPRRLDRVARLLEERAAAQHVDVRVEDQRQDDDRRRASSASRAAGSRRRTPSAAPSAAGSRRRTGRAARTRARRRASPAAARAPSRASGGRGSRRRRRARPASRRASSVPAPTPSGEHDARRAAPRAAASRRRRANAPGSATNESGSASSGPATSERDERAERSPTRGAPAPRPRRRRWRGYRHPTCCISATASGSRRPACSTSIGSSLTSAQSAMCAARRDVGVRGELAVGGDLALRVRRGQVLHQRDRVGAVLGALDEPDAARGWRARRAPSWSGHAGRDRELRVVVEHAAEVVVVGQADVAAAGGDRLEHVDVRAEDLRVVGHPASAGAPRSRPARAWRSGRRRATGCTRCSRCAGRACPRNCSSPRSS